MNRQSDISVRERRDSDDDWVEQQLRESWGSTTVISRGQAHDAARLPAFVAVQGERRVGLATLRYAGADCELVTLDALNKGCGIGSALFDTVAQAARAAACCRLWLITTNDNLDAMRFYQRRGMRFAAVQPGAVDDARRTKPTIPRVGEHGIPLHDEIEFELDLR